MQNKTTEVWKHGFRAAVHGCGAAVAWLWRGRGAAVAFTVSIPSVNRDYGEARAHRKPGYDAGRQELVDVVRQLESNTKRVAANEAASTRNVQSEIGLRPHTNGWGKPSE